MSAEIPTPASNNLSPIPVDRTESLVFQNGIYDHFARQGYTQEINHSQPVQFDLDRQPYLSEKIDSGTGIRQRLVGLLAPSKDLGEKVGVVVVDDPPSGDRKVLLTSMALAEGHSGGLLTEVATGRSEQMGRGDEYPYFGVHVSREHFLVTLGGHGASLLTIADPRSTNSTDLVLARSMGSPDFDETEAWSLPASNLHGLFPHRIPAEQPEEHETNTVRPFNAAEYMNGLGGEIQHNGIAAGWVQKDVKGEDTVYAFLDGEIAGRGIFAVFDGAGGSSDGAAAAQAAREKLHEWAVNNEGTRALDPFDSLDNLFSSLDRAIQEGSSGGYATAIVGVVEPSGDGGKRLYWGAVGDSLGFIIGRDDKFQLNREETARQDLLDGGEDEAIADRQGSFITNSLGYRYAGLRQSNSIELQPGDQIVLTSDGITGDNAEQRMQGGDNNLDVIQKIAHQPDLSAGQVAAMLVAAATKRDDRTALVIKVD